MGVAAATDLAGAKAADALDGAGGSEPERRQNAPGAFESALFRTWQLSNLKLPDTRDLNDFVQQVVGVT